MRPLVLGLFVSLAAACSSSGPACNASTCQGCCDANDQCQAGSAFDACGNGGTTCRACSATETCALNFCTSASTGGGGGAMGGGTGGGAMDAGTGGGGSATGGGTGGGMMDAGTGGGGGAMGGGSGTDAGTPPTVTVTTGNCAMVTHCASALVGTWFYTAACADDPLADFRSLCAGITSVSSSSQLSGRVDFTATTVTRSVTTNYTSTVNLPASCASLGCATIESLLQNTAPGATCVAAGTGCNCTLSGSSTLNESGTWTESNGVITVTTSSTTRTFDGCVTGDTLQLRETSTTSNTEKGTTTLTRQ